MKNKISHEQIISEIIESAVKGKTPKGDVSKALAEQGFLTQDESKTLEKRDPNLTGNPIESGQEFLKQNPN